MKLSFLVGLSTLLVACGGDPSDSNEDSDGGGGTGNSTIDLGSGGSADGGAGGTEAFASGGGTAGESGGAVSGGSGPDGSGGSGPDGSGGDGDLYPVPVCDPVPPACPEKILDGDLRVRELADFQEIEGVTMITGDLDIGSVESLSALDCLEQVGEKLLIDVEGSIAGILPRLRTVGYEVQLRSGGGIDIEDDPTSVDCALQSLVEVNGQGSVDTSRGLTGELDLSRLTQVWDIRIKNSHLSRVKMPSNLHLGNSQVAFTSNDELQEITGFENVTLGDGASFTGESYVIAIEGNPLLSGCRVQELEGYYRDAQYPESAFIIGNNGPGCE